MISPPRSATAEAGEFRVARDRRSAFDAPRARSLRRDGSHGHYTNAMIGRIFTVGGFTLLSRLTGFVRDIVLAAVLGAGPVADAFFVALRLPNHFRAIFAEGAFNAAFVPAYARIRPQGGADAARLFADRVFTLLFASQVVLLALALAADAAGDRAAGAGLCQGPRPLRARGRAHPDHLSLSAAGHAGDALWRHPQCARPLRAPPRRRSCSTSR